VRTVEVRLNERSYKIKIAEGLLPRLGRECSALGLGRRCAVFTDSRVAPLYSEPAMTALTRAGFEPVLITFPAGENSKRLRQLEACFNQMARHRLERKSFIVALGGGVVGDLAGFAAATWLRGVPFVQVPTTLLAQVDSSVGGKTGVNLRAGKNLVGAFYQPKLVLCDLSTLRSLPEREYQSGMAEVIKYGIIYDARLFRFLEESMDQLNNRQSEALTRTVARCCEIKAEVVAQDETESGLRAILNFGHTIGHAIEATAGYGKYLHGEAIAIGQVFAARLSCRLQGLRSSEADRMETLLQRAHLPTSIKLGPAALKKLMAAMKLDKKVSAGEVRFVLARRIGRVQHGCTVPEQALREELAVCSRAPTR